MWVRLSLLLCPARLLCVEHIDENDKPMLYLVFEYLDTDLKKFMDLNGRGPEKPLPSALIKVRVSDGGFCWLNGYCGQTF